MPYQAKNQSGFALLMTLVVVSVVISVALALIDLTIKQLRLSTGSKDSENAFHAANAGVECIRYWRVQESDSFETGDPVNMNCFGDSYNSIVDDISPGAVPNSVFIYSAEFEWGTGINTRCSQATFITMSTEPESLLGVTLSDVGDYIPSYPEADKTCEPGGRCTIISVKGVNSACTTEANYSIGTIQREVLLEL